MIDSCFPSIAQVRDPSQNMTEQICYLQNKRDRCGGI